MTILSIPVSETQPLPAGFIAPVDPIHTIDPSGFAPDFQIRQQRRYLTDDQTFCLRKIQKWVLAGLLLALCGCFQYVRAQTCDGVTIAGRNDQLFSPGSVFVDGAGYVYVAEQINNRILKFPPNSTSASSATTVAGGNGIGSQANQLYFPSGVFVSSAGYIYVADQGNHRVQLFPPSSTSATSGTTIAGGNVAGSGPTRLSYPVSVYVNGDGYFYVADSNNSRIQKFPPNSTSATSGTTVAGGNGAGSGETQLRDPISVFVDGSGYLFVADYNNHRIQMFSPASTSVTSGTTVAGGNGQGMASNQLNSPISIFIDGSGNRYIADNGNHRIQMFSPASGMASVGFTVAGGNGAGPAANQLNSPQSVFIDGTGNIYVADTDNHRIQRFPPNSTNASSATTIAGSNDPDVPATQLYLPSDVLVDGQGNRYVSDRYNHRILKFPVNSTSNTPGVVVAGGNGEGSGATQLNNPFGIFLDGAGNLYVADTDNHRIQKFPPTSTSATSGSTVAGGNGAGSNPNQFYNPTSIYVTESGNLYVADEYNHRVQKFGPNSTSDTGGFTFAGGNGPGPAANTLFFPIDIFVDEAENLYVAELGNQRIQKFPYYSSRFTSGTTVAGGNGSGIGPNQLRNPIGVWLDKGGNIYVSDYRNARVQRFPPNSSSAMAGVTVAGGNGEGGAANQLIGPEGIFLDSSGNLYIADQLNNRIQQVALTVVTQQPASRSLVSAGSAVSTFISTTGTPGTYQWFKDGLPVSGQTSATLSLSSVQRTDVGSYVVVVTTHCTSLTSTPFNLGLTIRYVKVGGSGDGSSWTAASGDLQSMVNEPGVQQVWVAAGRYTPTTSIGPDSRTISFSLKSGVAVYGGFVGTETSLDQRPVLEGPSSTTLSGDIGTIGDNTDNSYHVINNPASLSLTNSAILDGFVISGGNANGSGSGTGGGLYIENSSPLIRDCWFVNNLAASGGALYVYGQAAAQRLRLINCSFIGNAATYGGALVNNSANPQLINCSLIGNSASSGAGLYTIGIGSQQTLVNCSFQGNQASSGGGVLYQDAPVNSQLVNCVLWNNSGNRSIQVFGGSATVSYSLLEATVANYTIGSGNKIAGNTPFVSTTATQLVTGSLAFNAGDLVSYTAVSGPATDLAGNSRVNAGAIDMGAYELQCQAQLYVNASASGANTGLNWSNAFTDLQSAISAGCPSQKIWVAGGRYKPTPTTNREISFTIVSGTQLYGGFAGYEANLAERQLSYPSSTTLSGDIGTLGTNSDNAYHVVRLGNASASTRLDGFVIADGYADGVNPHDRGGGYLQ